MVVKMKPESVPRIDLAPGYSISRVLLGFWQFSGGHGAVDEAGAHRTLQTMLEAGFTTFDCADIYTGVEELLGRFLEQRGALFRRGRPPGVQVHTKYVPDLEALPSLTHAYTDRVIERSLRRLKIERLDLVQFHWWDFDIPGYVEAAGRLVELQRAGKIRHIGVTNFDAVHLQELMDAGIPVISDQVQYSVLDRRPEKCLVPLALARGIGLLSYGTLAGGFISDRYLGRPAPRGALQNRSLIKYRLIIREFGGWDRFQRLLRTLKDIAGLYGVGIAEVAIRYVLQRPSVAGVIIGVRNDRHRDGLIRLSGFELLHEDIQRIEAALSHAAGPAGPVFGLERDRTGEHGRIMKYNLNRIPFP